VEEKVGTLLGRSDLLLEKVQLGTSERRLIANQHFQQS
jgi:hypothetical protein